MPSSAPIAEYDLVVCLAEVQARVPGENTPTVVAAGTAGTVLLIHRGDGVTTAYEVEFPLGGGAGALATIAEHEIQRAPARYLRACSCCGCRTLADLSPGSYEICPVCFWEDDLVQSEDPAFSGGANRVSLNEARSNYLSFGACERASVKHVRPPEPSELPERK